MPLLSTRSSAPGTWPPVSDTVRTDPPKGRACARQVKALAQKALDEASDVLEDTITSVS